MTRPNASTALRRNRIDLAVGLRSTGKEREHKISILSSTDELVFLVSPLHPWAVSGSIPRAEIPRQNYVLYNKSSYTLFRMVEHYFRQEDMVLNTGHRTGHGMEAIKELVKLGLGVGILAPWIAQGTR